jgi:hypothetical protein
MPSNAKPTGVVVQDNYVNRVKMHYMTLTQILQILKQDRDRLSKAIAALEGSSSTRPNAPHKLSTSARARIAKAQRERWAKLRAAKKKTT